MPVRVLVETVLLGVWAGQLCYRTRVGTLTDRDHPDALARRLAGFEDLSVPGCLLHSTSWRFDPGGVILTYVALPDLESSPRAEPVRAEPVRAEPVRAEPLAGPVVPARGADPVHPSPPAIDPAQVVAHACQHLAYLRQVDPAVAAAAAGLPDLWALIDEYRPAVAGSLG